VVTPNMQEINSQRSEHASRVHACVKNFLEKRTNQRKLPFRSIARSTTEPSDVDGKPGGRGPRASQSINIYERYRARHFTARWNRRSEAGESRGHRLGAGRRKTDPARKHILVRRLGT